MIWPQCSRYPSLEGHLDFWMDYLKNVPFSVDEYQYLLEKSQSRANQSSRAPLCSTLTNETHSITQPPTKVATLATSEPNLAKSKDVSIEMEGLSRAKKNQRRNSCLSAFQTANESISPAATVEIHPAD